MSLIKQRRLLLISIGICIAIVLSSCHTERSNSIVIIPTQTTTATTTATTKPQITYILNTNKRSRRFHRPDCYSAKSIKDENRLEFNGTREQVIKQGYKPCGNCNP